MIKLPEPAKRIPWQTTLDGRWVSGVDDFYSAAQLKQAILDALTEAERICDHYATALDGGDNEYTRSRECMQAADAIRKLKEDIQ